MLDERPHKKLVLWQVAMEFVNLIYKLTDKFPKAEEFGLKSQLRRASVSIPSNIAEGLTQKQLLIKFTFLTLQMVH